MSPKSILFLQRFFALVLVTFSGRTLSNRSNFTYVCHRGTYLHTPRIGPEFCLPCTDGVNFMSESLHRERKCINCTQVRDETLEVLVSPCNKTHDAEFWCRDGYYKQRARNVREIDTCVRCSDCENVARTCQGYYDHVCCLPSYEAILSKDGFYECKERPLLCGAGEFLSLKTEQCTHCPPGTFMTSDKHNHTNCRVCQTLDDVGPHQEIVQPCNRTQPTTFGCQAGYFRNLLLGETSECQPCDECQNLIQKCGPFNNSVCCDLPYTRVEDMGAGLVCVSKEKGTTMWSENLVVVPVCGENEQPYYNATENVFVCLRYQQVTCVQEVTSIMLIDEIKTEKLDQTNTILNLLIVVLHLVLVITLVFPVIILKVSCDILSASRNTLIRMAKIIEIVLWLVNAVVVITGLNYPFHWMLIHILASIVTVVCLVVLNFTKLKKVDIDASFAFKGLDTSHKRTNITQTSLKDESSSDADTELIPNFESPTVADRETSWTHFNRQGRGTDNSIKESNPLLSLEEKNFYNSDVFITESRKGLIKRKVYRQNMAASELSKADQIFSDCMERHTAREEEVDLYKDVVFAKYPGHQNFISVNQFILEHLPDGYRNQDLLDCVRTLADIICRITAKKAKVMDSKTTSEAIIEAGGPSTQK